MRIISLFFLILISASAFGQEPYITVNHDSISLSEFKKVYAENIKAEGWQNALNSYTGFTLLNQEAEKTGIDTTNGFRDLMLKNLQSYRENYLFSSEVEKRLKNEIKPMLKTDKQAEIYAIGTTNPFDEKLLNERKKLATELRRFVCEKKPTTAAVKEFKEKNPVKKLWIRPFTATAEIEKAVFATGKGECSRLQKSENGWFFVKVTDEQRSSGIVHLEYIFNKDSARIHKAYQQLRSDKKWSEAKTEYIMYEGVNGFRNKPRFEADLPDIFYDQIDLQDSKTQISKPFKGNDGWYIIWVQDQLDLNDNSEAAEKWLERGIRQSDYAMEFVKHSEERALATVELTEDKEALNRTISALGKNFFARTDTVKLATDKPLWKTKAMQFTQKDLLKEMHLSRYYLGKETDQQKFITTMIPKFRNQFILNSYTQNLSRYEPQFHTDSSNLAKAVKVNYYLDSRIYDAAKEDIKGQQEFLNANREKYTFPIRYELEVFRFRTDEQGKQIQKMLKKKKSSEEILKHFDAQKDENGAIAVVLTKGKFSVNDGLLPADFDTKSKLQKNSMYNQQVWIRKIKDLPAAVKTIEEAGHAFQEDYRSHYYREHVENLRKNATIHIPETFKP